MADKNPSITVVTTPFILSYPKVLKPEVYQEPGGSVKGRDPFYSFEGISEIESLGAWKILNKETEEWTPGNIEKALVALAREKFGADFNVREAVKHGGLFWPFKLGDTKADEKGAKAEHYRGKKYWRAKSAAEINGSPNEPTLYEAAKDGSLIKLMRSTEAGKQRINELFYGGAIVTAELNAVAMQTPQGKYVTLYFNSLVFERDGDRLGGGSAIERLRGVSGGESNVDPTQGLSGDEGNLDDEIPF